jgi:hypothetical protein
MNWEAIGAIAELTGGIAVLVTLLYLAVQIRQTNRMQRQQICIEQTNRCCAAGHVIATNSEFADIFQKSLLGKELTSNEFMRLSGYLFSILTDFEEMYYTNKAGGQPEFRWHSLQLHIHTQLKPNTGGNVWWHATKRGLYTPEFIQRVDRLLENGPEI